MWSLRVLPLVICCFLITTVASDLLRSATLSYNHVVHVNCTPSSDSCLSNALGQAQGFKGSVLVQLTAGTFVLNSTVNASFKGYNDLAIVGAGPSDTTVIDCDKSKMVGLTFLNSSRITIANVSFKYCGALHNSTSKNFSSVGAGSNVKSMSYLKFRSALYFLFCSNITMQSVSVKYSEGSGVVVYNSGDINTFTDCDFSLNNLLSRIQYLGGSGMSIDFSYCIPGDISCQTDSVSKVKVSGSEYTFNNCKFSHNKAYLLGLPGELIYPHGSEHMTFGKGGGLSVNFGGQAIGNSFSFNNCEFSWNTAEHVGGGLYLKFGDISVNNTISIVNSHLSLNKMDCSESKNNWTMAGGGVKIDFVHYPPDNELWPGYDSRVEGNKVSFIDSHFVNNLACYGGAVSFVSSREPRGVSNSNSLTFDSCEFSANQADIASAVDLSIHYPDLVGQNGGLIQPSFMDCTFSENKVIFQDIHRYPLGIGALYANRVPVRFSGTTKFEQNSGTALVISSSYVSGGESSVMEFLNNQGRLGGAIAFFGDAWLIAHENSSYDFTGNSADTGGSGGAIYSVHFGEHDLPLQQNCFFQYYKSSLPPSKWNATFTFTDNLMEGERNSIYSTSILPCLWPNVETHVIPSVEQVFCGNHPWYFNGSSCREEITTGPSFLKVPETLTIPAVPGWPARVGIKAYNDYKEEIPTVLIAYPDQGFEDKVGVNLSAKYISNNSVILYGMENNSASLMLRTLDPRVIASSLNVDILSCPPGFVSVPCKDKSAMSGMTCNCVCPAVMDGMSCSDDDHNITLYSHFCLTYQYEENNSSAPNKSLPLVIGKCPFNQHTVTVDVSVSADDLNNLVCGKSSRTGVLCSICKESYGVAINSHYECVECNPAIGWLLFLVVKILPVTVLFFLVALLNIKATSAALNAFVFYSQIVSISYFYNPYPFFFGVLTFHDTVTKVLVALVDVPYGILNLDFFRGIIPPFCIGYVETLPVIAINYIVAFYPMLLIALCYICIKLYDRNFKPIRKLWQPFQWCLGKLHKNKKPTTSIIDAFATFLLLSYTNFLYVSFPLFQPVTVHDASDPYHNPIHDHLKFYYDASLNAFGAVYALIISCIVVVIIVIFVVAPPLFLILYPLKCVQSCISRLPRSIVLKTFAESFTESFRNGTEQKGGRDFRYFAGLYFLFRVAIFAVFVSELDWIEQYFVQQILFTFAIGLFAVARPYKIDLYNYLDLGVFVLLALQNACSLYNSYLMQYSHTISLPVFVVNYILLFIPLIYLAVYSIYYCVFSLHCLASCYKKESRSSESIVVITDSSSYTAGSEEPFSYVYDYDDSHQIAEDFPDRILRPQNYQQSPYKKEATPKIVVTRPTAERTPVRAEPERQIEASTENSYFLEKKKKQEFQVYGTIQHSGQVSRNRHSEPGQRSRRIHKLV